MYTPHFEYLNWVKARYRATRINLSSSGMPPPPDALVPISGAPRALDIVDTKGYEPLFRRIAAHLGVPPGSVLAVPGCTYAMHVAVRSVVGPGEGALVETPTYELLPRILEAGRISEVIAVPRHAKAGFGLSVDDVARAVTPRTRAILLTSPHNPSGRILDSEVIAGLDALARDRNLFVVVDEVYLDFHPRNRRDYASLAAVSDRFVVAGSLTKAHGLSSLRLGWISGPPEVMAEAWRWQEILADRIPALDAQAGCVAFDHMASLEKRAYDAYQEGFPRVARWARAAGLELLDPGAGITALLRLPDGVDSNAIADLVFEKEKVLVPPGEMFGAPGWLRISFAIPEPVLREGLDILGAAINRAR